jgi:hypothetical protein
MLHTAPRRVKRIKTAENWQQICQWKSEVMQKKLLTRVLEGFNFSPNKIREGFEGFERG